MSEDSAKHRPKGRPLVNMDVALPPLTKSEREHHAALVRVI